MIKIDPIPINFMSKSKSSISVFFPAYNEAGSIGDLIAETYRYLDQRFDDFEILVVSEGSTDNTNEIVKLLEKHIPRLRLVSRPENFGYAGALRTGFKNSTKELIFYTDGDGQFDIRELDKLLSLLEENDIVTGYKIKRHDPLMRIWTSWLYNKTMRLLFGLKLKDINCAFKLYRRQVIDSVDFLTDLVHGVINAEIYLSALKKGYSIGEVGVHHYPRLKGDSGAEFGRHGKVVAWIKPKVVWGFLIDTLRLWKKFH